MPHPSGYPVIVSTMGGIGDSIYSRPFVRAAAERWGEVWAKTPWPQFYEDDPAVHPMIWPRTGLRTQDANTNAQPEGTFSLPPIPQVHSEKLGYGLRWGEGMSILGQLADQLPLAKGQEFKFRIDSLRADW